MAKKLNGFRPMERNANKHTPRGMALLEDSIQRDGYVAPMTATADGTIIDGNARLETVATALPADPIVVEHDGTRPVIMVRSDIPNADDPRAKRIAVAANRIGSVDLDWDAEVLNGLAGEIDLSGMFSDKELAEAMQQTPDFQPVTEDEQGRLDQKKPVTCPSCGVEFVPKG